MTEKFTAQRSIKKARRQVGGGSVAATQLKKAAARKHRRSTARQLSQARLDVETFEYDATVAQAHGRDIS